MTPISALGVGGPVSAALGDELQEVVRKQGVVLWLDLDGHYTAFVDRLRELRRDTMLAYDVCAFRGSYLELMMALEGLAAASEKPRLLIHLPGFNEESVRETPLFELYAAGVRHRKALDTLVKEAAAGRVSPEDIARFIQQPGLTLDSADAWLAARLDGRQTGLSARLGAMTPMAILDELLANSQIAHDIERPEGIQALWDQLAVSIGLPSAWRESTLPPGSLRAEDAAFAAASWVMGVEYVDDLKRAPVSRHLSSTSALPRPLIDVCRTVARYLRDRHPDFYERTADETEVFLADEVEAARAEDLGKIDTFRFEEDKVLHAALLAVASGEWPPAAEWAAPRVESDPTVASFWLRRDPSRQSAWQLVDAAARLGHAVAHAGGRLPQGRSLDEGLQAYADRGAAVDHAHREFEQRWTALRDSQLPHFETLRASLDGMRQRWRLWADNWARDFNALCRAHGFLPSVSAQQRTIFDEVVRPMALMAPTAYFVVDAFRYEMGNELYQQIVETQATTVQLKARLAELPTVTEIGMNVLAPVASNGRLKPAMSANGGGVLGFATGEFRVSDPATRKRAMHDRVGGAACPWLSLDDVVSRDSASLKRSISHARLVVVHNREIDRAGEAGVGPGVFALLMRDLRMAWQLLREAGVRQFVFTADHGFLLFDAGGAGPQPHGRRIDPKRRHVLSPVAADHSGEVRVALADLGYDGADGYLMFPETTARFDTARGAPNFAHGGNSLQERAIPVLTVVHRAAVGGSTSRYAVSAAPKDGVAGMHCVEIRVAAVDQGTLDFGSPREVELSMRVLDIDSVQVELCQARGNARLVGGSVQATVGDPFELFFRLSGPAETRVRVELIHSGTGAEVAPCVPDMRFAVSAMPSTATATSVPPTEGTLWLDLLPEGGVRQLFRHLAVHGTVTESEAAGMLGGARGLRRFALEFDTLVQKAPWSVRIDVVAGVKRYVREGSNG